MKAFFGSTLWRIGEFSLLCISFLLSWLRKLNTNFTNSLSIFTSSEFLRKQLSHPSSSSVPRPQPHSSSSYLLPSLTSPSLRSHSDALIFHVRKYVEPATRRGRTRSPHSSEYQTSFTCLILHMRAHMRMCM